MDDVLGVWMDSITGQAFEWIRLLASAWMVGYDIGRPPRGVPWVMLTGLFQVLVHSPIGEGVDRLLCSDYGFGLISDYHLFCRIVGQLVQRLETFDVNRFGTQRITENLLF